MRKFLLFVFLLSISFFGACLFCGCDTNSGETRKISGTDISSDVMDIDLKTDTGYITLPNGTSFFNFNNNVNVSDTANYSVCSDISGKDVIPSRVVTLNAGDNLYYLIVTQGNEVRSYTVNIFVNYLGFNANPSYGEISYIEKFKNGEKQIETNVTEYLGCEFIGWFYGEKLKSTNKNYVFNADRELTAKFKIKEEMNDFIFMPMKDFCEITGIKDKTLETVYIPDCVTSIGEKAFDECSKLTNIIISNSLTHINDNSVFGGCKLLTEIDYLGNIDDWCKIEGIRNLMCCNTSLKNLYINEKLVTEANITKATKINDCAFYCCNSLTSVTISDSVKSIGARAFEGCGSLTKVNYLGTIDSWCEISFGDDRANPLCYALNLYINDKLVTEANITKATKINDYAFCCCESLTSISIPNTITTIGEDAFTGCSSLRFNEYENGFYLGNNDTPYLVLVRAKNFNITNCIIHNKCKFICSRAYFYCSLLTSIIIPDSVISIGSSAFSSCIELSSIIIGNGVKSIGSYAFVSCKITSIVIPESVESIGNYAFNGCFGLTSLLFNDTTTWYSTYDFWKWSNKTGGNLIDVTNPESNATKRYNCTENYLYKI